MKKSPVTIIISIALGVSLLANVFLGIKLINSDGTEVKADITLSQQEANENNKETEAPGEEKSEFTPYELSGNAQTLQNTDMAAHTRYDFEIKSARLDKDYADRDIVVITYTFTNHDESAISFSSNLEGVPCQNGVGLEEAYTLSGNRNLKGDRFANVMPNYTGEFELAYYITDSTSDIVVLIQDSWAPHHCYATRTFTMK